MKPTQIKKKKGKKSDCKKEITWGTKKTKILHPGWGLIEKSCKVSDLLDKTYNKQNVERIMHLHNPNMEPKSSDHI